MTGETALGLPQGCARRDVPVADALGECTNALQQEAKRAREEVRAATEIERSREREREPSGAG